MMTIIDSAAPTLDELLDAMEKGPATAGWDVVASYSVTALNAILAAQHSDGKLAAHITFSEDIDDPITGQEMTLSYDFMLDAPTLSFLGGQSGTCTLSMPLLSGSYTVTPDGGTAKTTQIPPSTYTLIAVVPLAAMYGNNQIATSGTVVVLDPGATANIIIHFKSGAGSGTIYSISPTPGPDDHDPMDTYFLPLIRQYFEENVSELDYLLTSVSQTPQSPAPPNSGITLQPKSFVFGSDTGFLSVYIQTIESGFPQGDQHPAFQPGGIEISPIPQQHTASVIFSKELIKSLYLKPGLSASGTVTFDDTAPTGIRALLQTNQPTISYNPSHLGRDQLKIDTMTIDYSQLLYTIEFAGETAHVKWEYSQDLSWSTDDCDPGTGDCTHEDGHTTLYATLDKVVTLNNLNSDSFELDLSIASTDYKCRSEGAEGWFSDGGGIQDDLVSQLENNSLPSIKLNLGSLTYIAEANILFPALHLFNIDANAGMNVPLDLLIIGSLVQS